jgi:biotin carboxylase
MLAKVIVHAETRAAAIERMDEALASFQVDGIHTTIPFLKSVIKQTEFREGQTHVRWIEALLARASAGPN